MEPSTSGCSYVQSPFPGYMNTEGRAEYLPPQLSRGDCTQCWKKYMSHNDFSCTVHPRESPAYVPSAEAGGNWAAPSYCPNCTDRYGGEKCSLCKYRLQILRARQMIAEGLVIYLLMPDVWNATKKEVASFLAIHTITDISRLSCR